MEKCIFVKKKIRKIGGSKNILYICIDKQIFTHLNFYLMKNRNTVLATFLALVLALPFGKVSAQATETPAPTTSVKVTADLVSHYVWRGSMATAIKKN